MIARHLITLGTWLSVTGVAMLTGIPRREAWLALVAMHVGTANRVGLGVNVEKMALALQVMDLGEGRTR